MFKEKIVIVGAGGFARETLDVFEASNKESEKWDIKGFVDDNPRLQGTVLRGYPVLGGVDWLATNGKDLKAVIAIADTKTRKKIAEKLEAAGVGFCTIIHPNVVMTPHVTVGKGCIICAGCILTNNIKIGNHVILNLDITVGHDTVVGDYSTLSPGIHVSGINTIGEGVFMGTGAVTIQDLTIGEWSVIGAGAVVLKDIPPRVVAVGVPAKEIKKIKG